MEAEETPPKSFDAAVRQTEKRHADLRADPALAFDGRMDPGSGFSIRVLVFTASQLLPLRRRSRTFHSVGVQVSLLLNGTIDRPTVTRHMIGA